MIWANKVSHYGNKNKNKTIFLIDYPTRFEGFGGMVRTVCSLVLLAKKRGWIPYIFLNKKPSLYVINDFDNMWEYYFKNTSELTIDEVMESANVISCSNNYISTSYNLYNPYQCIIDRDIFYYQIFNVDKGKNILKTLFSFNEETYEEILKRTSNIMRYIKDKRAIGVLCRGTDFRKEGIELWGGECASVEIKKVISRIKGLMFRYNCDYVFVATEDEEYFQILSAEFGDKMLFIEQDRVENLNGKLVGECLPNSKEFVWKYLSSIYILSKCPVYLSNIFSGASTLAQTLNDGEYEYFEIMN